MVTGPPTLRQAALCTPRATTWCPNSTLINIERSSHEHKHALMYLKLGAQRLVLSVIREQSTSVAPCCREKCWSPLPKATHISDISLANTIFSHICYYKQMQTQAVNHPTCCFGYLDTQTNPIRTSSCHPSPMYSVPRVTSFTKPSCFDIGESGCTSAFSLRKSNLNVGNTIEDLQASASVCTPEK